MADQKTHPLRLAWAAGLYEGKGGKLTQGYKMKLDSVNEALLQRFCSYVGKGKVTQGKTRAIYSIHSWQTFSMDDSREVLLSLIPFFSGKILKDATEMIARIERSETWRLKNPDKVAQTITTTVENPKRYKDGPYAE